MIGTSSDVLRQVVADVDPQDGVFVDILTIARVQVCSHHDDHVALLALRGFHSSRHNLQLINSIRVCRAISICKITHYVDRF